MKMTNEEKQAFFAQYWGQRACVCNDGFIRTIGVTCDVSDIEYLKLRTVEQLERHEIENICEMIWGIKIDRNLGFGRYIEDLMNPTSNYYFTRREVVDEYRRLGILAPFRHFTPEMLIAEGVVKVKGV